MLEGFLLSVPDILNFVYTPKQKKSVHINNSLSVGFETLWEYNQVRVAVAPYVNLFGVAMLQKELTVVEQTYMYLSLRATQ